MKNSPNDSSLLVFIGKPGAGKSTLIDLALYKYNRIDVMPFVKKYEENEKVPEEKTVVAYHDMYNFLKTELQSNKRNIVLELGTNHADLNINELKSLNENFRLVIFLCDAPIDVCRDRVKKRTHIIDDVALELRLQRNFPESHLDLLKNTSIKYVSLNMERPLNENVDELFKYID